MCGILVITNSNISRKKLDSSLTLMTHRGPDYTNSLKVDGHYFGHVRLAILDLNERSNQPFQKDGIIITFNGEIYNYLELINQHRLRVGTTSDTEVIIEMYKKYGENCLQYFNGMFAFVIYNTNTKKIFIARDRLGIKPLYTRTIKESTIYSSEIESILNIKEDELHEFGMRQYYKLRMTIKNETVYKNIRQFPPGYYSDGKKLKQYWKLNIETTRPPKYIDLFELIKNAVTIRNRADVKVGSYLSGGLDSTILSFLLNPSHTWTVGFNSLNEFNWSELANKKLNSIHTKTIIDKNEFLELTKYMVTKRKEPLSVPNEVLIYKMTKAVKMENTVVLSGEGADELFFGYDRIFKWANRLKSAINIQEFDQYYCYGTNKDDEVLDYALEGLPGNRPIDKIAYFFQITHLQGLLRRLDNSTMLCSVEARVPFVDHRLIEMMAGTPFEWRMGASFKDPLKKIFNDVIPKEITNRKKVGFPVPLDKIFLAS